MTYKALPLFRQSILERSQDEYVFVKKKIGIISKCSLIESTIMGSVDSISRAQGADYQIKPYHLSCNQLKKEMKKVRRENLKLKRKIDDLKYQMFPYSYWAKCPPENQCSSKHLKRNILFQDAVKYTWMKNKREICK